MQYMRSASGVLVSQTTPQNVNWWVNDGIIYTLVTSNGTAGKDWPSRLDENHYDHRMIDTDWLRSPEFIPTDNLAYLVAILKCPELKGTKRRSHIIREVARDYKFSTPKPELGFLLREKLSDTDLKTLGFFSIVIMHESIVLPNSGPQLINISRVFSNSINMSCGNKEQLHDDECGFAFIASKTNIYG